MDKLRILIAENNGLFRQTLKGSLQVSLPGVAIHEVADGREVLEKIDILHPDLIFMDIRLPGENGLNLTKKIKAVHPDTKIFALTSYDIPEYREAAFKYGADRFLAKTSLNPRELEELVKSCQKV